MRRWRRILRLSKHPRARALWQYAVAPQLRYNVARYRIESAQWRGAPLRIALVADLHARAPWMSPRRIRDIVRRTNALGADIICLLGDHVHGHWFGRPVPEAAIATELAALRAEHGVFGVLGNHDWKEDPVARRRKTGPTAIGTALKTVGLTPLENAAFRVERPGGAFWVAGLGDQRAFGKRPPHGVDDLPATLAALSDEAPAILLAHEPDIFPEVPDRIALTVSGHTHGGQIRLFGRTPIVPSKFGTRFVRGHIQEAGRDLVVSAGLGCSGLPLRLGIMPELVVVDLSASEA